jgi:hypothetical protein
LPLAYDDRLRVQSSADRHLEQFAAGLRLSDSFHTNGFYARESSHLRQLLPAPADATGRADE